MRRSAMIVVAVSMVWIMSTAQAATLITLHSFVGGNGDGSFPVSALIADRLGNLYGTTAYGGANGQGTVFELEHSGNNWNEIVLYSFAGGNDGASPRASLVFDKAGNLYGTTRLGGPAGAGTVFELSPSGGSWKESVLYAFTGGNDGWEPQAPMTIKGTTLYGTAPGGGAKGNGVVFQLSKVNGVWQQQVIYSFAGGNSDGSGPYCQLILDKQGNMYGTAESGGPNQAGSVFELKHSKSGWTEQTLHFFTGNSDGSNPNAGVIFDKAGNLYGLTTSGGTHSSGTAFELSPSQGGWNEKVIYNFTGGQDGGFPSDGVIADNKGNLYGTAFNGGANGWGTVFELTNSGGNWTETVLYSFTDGNDGAFPLASLLYRKGKLFGVADEGGTAGLGTAFEIVK